MPEELFDFFRSHVDKISLRITVFQQHIFQHRNLFCIDADWFVSSIVDTNSELRDHDTYERLNNILQLQEDILKSQSKTIFYNTTPVAHADNIQYSDYLKHLVAPLLHNVAQNINMKVKSREIVDGIC